MTPLGLFFNGYFWVVVFFILSGFVLPVRFFATRRPACIYGGTFRRYLRLMLPLFVIISIYYLIVKMGWANPHSFQTIKTKTFFELILDGTIGTWLNNKDYTYASWTLSIELWATFFVYLIANTVIHYQRRWAIYLALFVFFITPMVTDAYKYTKYHISKKNTPLFWHMPIFLIGVVLSDMEHVYYKGKRPLDYIREWNIWWSIVRNVVLLFLFVSYGSYDGEHRCKVHKNSNCDYWMYATFNFFIPVEVCFYIGALSIILLALVSEWT